MLRLLCFFVVLAFNLLSLDVFASNKLFINNGKIFKPTNRDLVYGSKDAKVQVLEYFTLTCPHCENFFTTIFPKIKKDYIDTGKIMWIKRSFVTDFSSAKGTALLYCLDKTEYEKYLGILLVKQSSWAYHKDPLPILRNIAALGGMSYKDFNACMENKEIMKEIHNISEDAKKILKISGTPAFYVNQKKINIYTYSSFKEYLDKVLEENSSADQKLSNSGEQ